MAAMARFKRYFKPCTSNTYFVLESQALCQIMEYKENQQNDLYLISSPFLNNSHNLK